jgi:hypothetical protein
MFLAKNRTNLKMFACVFTIILIYWMLHFHSTHIVTFRINHECVNGTGNDDGRVGGWAVRMLAVLMVQPLRGCCASVDTSPQSRLRKLRHHCGVNKSVRSSSDGLRSTTYGVDGTRHGECLEWAKKRLRRCVPSQPGV